MAISEELRAQILRLFHAERWRVGTIARQLGVHHSTVERVRGEYGVRREHQLSQRSSMLDEYVPFIVEILQRLPTMTASSLYGMVRVRGRPGVLDHFRHRVVQLFPRREADLLFEVVTRSYLCRPTVVTTNKPFAEWHEVFPSAGSDRVTGCGDLH